ncbi:hypothetical protein INT45_007628, partial [Circinella minor]
FPAVIDMEVGLDTTDTAINASLSVFVFVTAFFPLLWTMLAERYGSRPIYLISFLICLVGNICCALSVNIAMFIGSRAISAMGSSSMMALGGGTIADIFEPHQRGRAFGYFTSGVVLGPAVSPIIGGCLNQGFGWRSIFWFLSIVSLFIWLGILLILPETKKLLSVELKKVNVEEKYKGAKEEEISSSKTIANSNQEKKLNLNGLLGPLQFFRFPNVTLTTVFIGILSLTLYIINANFARIYIYQYGLDSVGFALIIPNIIVSTYLMDCFSRQSSSVLACNNLVRFSMSGIGFLIASDIHKVLEPGILYTICGTLNVLVSGSIIIIRMNGKKWAIQRSRFLETNK